MAGEAEADGTTRARIVAEVCERIAHGDSVRACFRNPQDHWPTEVTFWRWLSADVELNAVYEGATAKRGERYAEEIVDIVDNAGSPLLDADGMPLIDRNGWPVMVVDKAAVEHARLRADARKWVAARMLPKRYGDKVTLAGDADNPLAIDVVDARAALLRGLAPKPAGDGAAGTSGGPDE